MKYRTVKNDMKDYIKGSIDKEKLLACANQFLREAEAQPHPRAEYHDGVLVGIRRIIGLIERS